jgi:hypothetical protein
LIVAIVGPDTRDASMIFSLRSAAATVPLLYIRPDSVASASRYSWAVLADALANLVVFATFVIPG